MPRVVISEDLYRPLMVLLLAVIQFRAYSICQTAFGTRLHEDSQRCCPRSSCNGRSNYWGGKLRRDRGIRRPRRKAPTAGDWQGKAPGDVGIFAVGGRSPSRRYLHRSHSGCIVRSPPHVWDPDPNTTHYSVRTGASYEPEYLKERIGATLRQHFFCLVYQSSIR